ncbi:hypothetical protein ALC57_16593 [Trachymyrmex cornetzi]|uniref:Phospholipase A2-like domain-containing protein n=1 Tax=Trachymyrmex cornetzi TaxID=471704 RepID=A0A151IUZ0_9HYME|nr:hypothetical protein ALC57_16593 [Trachymyrmex cornetzi]
MFLIVSDDLHSLTSKELEYIPKIVLLRQFEYCIDLLWDRLPEHIRADSERMPSRGLLNRAINALPFELHIPEYQFCGPRTRLEKRLARGDRGINPLDAACREHDIAYSHSNDLTERHAADNILAEKARKRITASDSTLRKLLAVSYFPAVDLGDGDYKLGLTDFETYYTLANVNSASNKFDDEEIPDGSYELRDIERYLKREILRSHMQRVRRMKNSRW